MTQTVLGGGGGGGGGGVNHANYFQIVVQIHPYMVQWNNVFDSILAISYQISV